jgi:hypothetical protein
MMDCSSHSNQTSEHIPKRLYRYRSLDGVGLLRTERTLVHNEIYLTSPAHLNDPFDCVVGLDFAAPNDDWHNFLIGLSRRKQPHLSAKDHAEWVSEVIRTGKHKEKEIHSLIRNGLQSEINSTGLLCLTERNDCILMWSHYANSHTGICLEFANDNLDPLIAQSQRVNYMPFYKKAHAIYDDSNAQVNLILLSKARCWAYEAEWRKIDHEEGYGLKQFSPETLTGVILGCKITVPHEKSILKWVSERYSPMRVYKAKQSPDGFRIEIREFSQ